MAHEEPVPQAIDPALRAKRDAWVARVRALQSAESGTETRIVESLHPIVIALFVGVFVVLPLVLGGFGRSFIIWLALLFFSHIVMYFIGFVPAARKAEDRIRHIAE